MSVILRRAGRALACKALALAQLAALEPCAREAEERVSPDRGSVLTERRLGPRELVDRAVESAGEPVDEAGGVRGPRDLGGVADARRVLSRRIGGSRRADVIARVRQQMRELALHARGHQVARAATRRGGERVLRSAREREGCAHVIRRGPNDRRAEPKLRQQQGVGRGGLFGHRLQPVRLLAPHEVVREMQEIDGDARVQRGILHQRQDRVELGPREVERLEVLQTARAQHAALERLASAGELWKKSLGIGAREWRERLLAQGGHACGGNAFAMSAT